MCAPVDFLLMPVAKHVKGVLMMSLVWCEHSISGRPLCALATDFSSTSGTIMRAAGSILHRQTTNAEPPTPPHPLPPVHVLPDRGAIQWHSYQSMLRVSSLSQLTASTARGRHSEYSQHSSVDDLYSPQTRWEIVVCFGYPTTCCTW